MRLHSRVVDDLCPVFDLSGDMHPKFSWAAAGGFGRQLGKRFAHSLIGQGVVDRRIDSDTVVAGVPCFTMRPFQSWMMRFGNPASTTVGTSFSAGFA